MMLLLYGAITLSGRLFAESQNKFFELMESFVTLRPMVLEDLDVFNNINLDHWTEMYTTQFYTQYFIKDPDLCIVAESASGALAGYLLAKVEGSGPDWHSHISALSVAPEFRRAGVGRMLLEYFEGISEAKHKCYFADLYVRVSNSTAIDIYKSRGYVVYRVVTDYYSGEEDGYDMRKPLKRDVDLKSILGAGKTVTPEQLPVYS
jgi:N-terminal acetyltransferase B complex catalytic subunit